MTSRTLLLRLVCAGAFFFLATPSHAQTDFEKAIKQYDGETVKGYIQPFVDLFGANMQSGYYHSAEIPTDRFHITLNFIAMGTIIGDDQKNYTAPTPEGFSPRTFRTSTIFGGKGITVGHATIPGLSFKGSDGIINSQMLTLIVPQLTIGSLLGTEVCARYIPIPQLGDGKFPSASLWGVGLRHSISQYIADSPADLAVGGLFNRFTLGDYIDFRGFTVGVQASKRLDVWVVYGGISYEAGTMKLTYQTTDPQVPPVVNISLDAANSIRFTAGGSFHISAFQLYADVGVGAVTTLTVGVGFGN